MSTQPAHAQAPQAAPSVAPSPSHSAPAARRPNPLLTVLRWELRRAFASRSTWVLVVLLFGIMILLLWFSGLAQDFFASATVHTPSGGTVHHEVEDIVTRNSLFGLAIILPSTLIEFALFLPFVTADGVSLDLKRRTHELLMTTALPSWAYVWGRYLAGMLIALGMACEYLLAMLTVAVGLHIWAGSYYPALDLPAAVVIWAVVVLPPTLVLSSLCFACGLLFPRQSNQIKGGAVFTWFMIGLVLQAFTFDHVRYEAAFVRGNPPAWWAAYQTWQPTNTDAGHLFFEQFIRQVYAIVNNGALGDQMVQQRIHVLEGQMPDLGSFTLAHVVLVVAAVAVVAAASLAFRRFRSVLA